MLRSDSECFLFKMSTFFGAKESGQKETAAPARAGANSFRGFAKAPGSLREINAELLDARPLEFAYALRNARIF